VAAGEAGRFGEKEGRKDEEVRAIAVRTGGFVRRLAGLRAE
jgi:hypothetical protein